MSNTTNVTHVLEDNVRGGLRFWVIGPIIVLILITCLANIIVMLVTTVDIKLKGITYMYVTSLAVADFLVGFAVMPAMLMYTMYEYWPLNSAWCTIWQVFDFALCSVSISHLCLIAFDRFVATVYPISTYLQYPEVKIRRTRIKIVLAWVVGIMVWLPSIVIIRDRQLKQGTVPLDDCFFMAHKIFNITQSVFVYYIPILIIIYFYVRIVYVLYQSKNTIQKMLSTKDTKNCGSEQEGVSHVGSINLAFEEDKIDLSRENTVNSKKNNRGTKRISKGPLKKKDSDKNHQVSELQLIAEKKQNARNRRITQTLGIVIVVFLICWLPYYCAFPIDAFCDCIHNRYYEFTVWSAYINSTLNPILYFIINRDFREALKRLIFKFFPRNCKNDKSNSVSSVVSPCNST